MTTDESVPTSAGLSSFNLLDEQKLFSALAPKPGITLLDFGCGVGNYSLAFSRSVGNNGTIYAADLWEEGIETLDVRLSLAQLENIRTIVCGAGERLPLEKHSVDLCLMATVMHILVREELIRSAFHEIQRVLKPGGVMAIVEFYKKEGPPGPPVSWRLSPEELEHILNPCGFSATGTFEVGPHNYLSLFVNAN